MLWPARQITARTLTLPVILHLAVVAMAADLSDESSGPVKLGSRDGSWRVDVTTLGDVVGDGLVGDGLVAEVVDASLVLMSIQEKMHQTPTNSTSTNSTTNSTATPEAEIEAELPPSKAMSDKVMMAISAAQSSTKIKSALEAAKAAVVAAKESAAHAMSLAQTPAEKRAALEQVAVAKNLKASYDEQYKTYNPFADTGKDASTFSELEQDAQQQEIATEQKAASQQYLSTLQQDDADQKARNDAYAKTVADQTAPGVPLLPAEEPGMYTKAQTDKMIADSKEVDEKAHEADIQRLEREWAAKQSTAVANAVNAEETKAQEIIRASEEKSEKQIAIKDSEKRLAMQKAALEIERMRLQNVQHAAASAALTASLNAKAEADKIERQADVLAAHAQYQAANNAIVGMPTVHAAIGGLTPNGMTPVTNGTTNGTNGTTNSTPPTIESLSSGPVSDVVAELIERPETQEEPAIAFQAQEDSSSPGGPTDLTPEDAVQSTSLTAVAQKHAIDEITKAVRLQVQAEQADQYTQKANEEVQREKLQADSLPLVDQYNQAEEELEHSTSDEKHAKTDAKGSIVQMEPSAVYKLRTAHAGAATIAQQMRTSSQTAVAESGNAVKEAQANALKVFQKSARVRAEAQMHKQQTGPGAARAAAQLAAAASAKAELTRVQAAGFSAMATNLQTSAMQQKEDAYIAAQAAMAKSITDERSSKARAKATVDENQAAIAPIDVELWA